MNSFALKIIACLLMLADHIGYFSPIGFNTTLGIFLRAAGRLSFPIFCYLIAYGFQRTHNKYFYLLRLILLGLISEVPFSYCFKGQISFISFGNVYYTLSLGLASLIIYDLMVKSKTFLRFLSPLPVIMIALFSYFLGTDYKFWGVLLIFFFYIFRQSKTGTSAVCALFAARNIIVSAMQAILNQNISYIKNIQGWSYIQLFAILAIIPILLFNGSRGPVPHSKTGKLILQYSFYFFYPAHLLILGKIMHCFIL